MSFETEEPEQSFGGFKSDIHPIDIVWPKADTTWDTFNQREGIDMTIGRGTPNENSFRSWNTGQDNNQELPSYRVSNLGAEFSAPAVSDDANLPGGHLLFPLGEGGLNPRTAFDFWSPGQALSTLATFSRLLPGVNQAGMIMAKVGETAGDSIVGRALDQSPLHGAGSFVGNVVTSLLHGLGTVIGDSFSSLPEVQQAWQDGDIAQTMFGLAKLGPANWIGATGDRIIATIRGNEDAREQLIDEASFLATVLTFGVGSGTGAIGAVGKEAVKQGAKVGLARTAHGVFKEGLTEYTLNPALARLAQATKFGMAGGYGIEIGSEVTAHWFPDWDKTNQWISEQSLVGDESPFKGLYELGVGSLVDPMPALGAVAESKFLREQLNSGFARLPSPVQRTAIYVKDGMKNLINPEVYTQEMYAATFREAVLKKIEGEGMRDISEDYLNERVREMLPTLLGTGEKKFKGLASDHTNLQAELSAIYNKWFIQAKKEHELMPLLEGEVREEFTMAHMQKRWEDTKDSWKLLDEAAAKGPARSQAALVNASTLTDEDWMRMGAYLDNQPEWVKAGGQKSKHPMNTLSFIDDFSREFKAELAYMNSGGGRVLTMTRANFYELGAQHMEIAPKELWDGPLGEAAKAIRAKGSHKAIARGTNRALGETKDPITGKITQESFTRIHPAAKEAENLLDMRLEDGKGYVLQDLYKLYEDAGMHDAKRLLAKWEVEHVSMYSLDGVIRPWLKPDLELAKLMPTSSNKFGNIVSNFREMVPNMELGRKMQERFYMTHRDAPGLHLTRAESNAYGKRIREEADKNHFATPGAYAAGGTPKEAGKTLQSLAIELFGKERVGANNMGQLMEKSMPTESVKDFVNILIGKRHGEIGVAPSTFAALRALRNDRMGDFYRWWAQVGHPMMRYDISPLFLLQMPFESRIWNWLRGASHASHDGITAPAVDDAISDFTRSLAGKTAGEQRQFGITGMESGASERLASRSGASPQGLVHMSDFMFDQVMADFPSKFAQRMKIVMPGDYKLLRKSYDSDKDMVEHIIGEKQAREDFLKGKLTDQEINDYWQLHNERHRFADTTKMSPTEFPWKGPVPLQGINNHRGSILTDPDAMKREWEYWNENPVKAAKNGDKHAQRILDRPAQESDLTNQETYDMVMKYSKKFGIKPQDAYNDLVLQHEFAHSVLFRKVENARGSDSFDFIDNVVHTEKTTQKLAEIYYQRSLETGLRPKTLENARVITDQLMNAMRDSARQAQTTHIGNPMRKYWEKSFSHPVLMYPLSWTLKAVGEWSNFLTHSAFGYHTGLGGLATWNNIRDDTMRTLSMDPEAMEWIKNHPETIKIMEYLMPGMPNSPIPGDNAGVGFGLLSVPLRNGIQLGYNLANKRQYDENMSDMSKIGVVRDMKALPKLWSEWALGKPETTIDNPGLTVGKKRHQTGFDNYINETFSLTRR